MDNLYYTYAYLRKDGTPYYIGKGKGHRAYSRNRSIPRPRDTSRILILKKGLSEADAFKHERYMIFILGRKSLGVGILHNQTNGGEGTSGHTKSRRTKQKIGDGNRGKMRTIENKKQIADSVRGFNWYNNGKKNIQSRFHPGEGWIEGRILDWESSRNRGMKWYHREGERKMFVGNPGEGWIRGKPTLKGKKYYNNGTEHVLAFTSPGEGWVLGRLKRK